MMKKLIKEVCVDLRDGWDYIFMLDKRERDLLEKINDYTVQSDVFKYYKENVRNNELDTYLLCERKLKRNIVLGKRLDSRSDDEVEYFQYGNLTIGINNRFKEVFFIENIKGAAMELNISERKKRIVERFVGLE